MANCLSPIFLTLMGLLIWGQGIGAVLRGTVYTDSTPLTDVVVSATPTVQSPRLPSSKSRPVTLSLDQKRKEFIPHVLPVRAGTAVSFPNSDEIQHHVYSFSSAKRFEIKLYKGTPSKPVIFDQPGVAALGCNIHDWMLGFVYVTDTPYFTKSDSAGRWSIDLPEGEYLISFWHPDAASPEQLPTAIVRVPFSQPMSQSISLKLARQSGKPPSTLQLEAIAVGFEWRC